MAHIKDIYLKQQRNRDLFSCYQEALKQHTFKTQRNAVDYVRVCKAPRFYISAHSAAEYINDLIAGRFIGNVNASSLRRINEIYKRYKELRSQDAYKNASVISICREIVLQPAPEFYIGYDLASKVICRELKCHNNRMAKYARKLSK